MEDEVEKVRNAPAGERNDQLNASSYALAQLVGGGVLDENEVEAQLLAAGLACGLAEGEILPTMRSGIEAGKLQPRYPTNNNGYHSNGYDGFGPMPGDETKNKSSDSHNSWPYEIEGGRIIVQKEVATKEGIDIISWPVCDFTAHIAGEIILEDGDKIFQIQVSGLRGGKTFVEIAAADFGNKAKLLAVLEAASPYDPIRAQQSAHIGPAIKLLTTGALKQTQRFTRTGWHQNTFLIPGRESEGVEIQLPRKLPYCINADADLDRGLEAFESLLLAMGPQLGNIILAHLLQAPLAKQAGWRNERYGLFLRGRTGSLKTSFAQTAMCLYGPDFQRDDTLLRWGEGATRNALMQHAANASDMPLLIDNFKPSTGEGERGFINLAHTLMEGSEKDRLDRSSHLKASRPVHTWPVFTGEDLPTRDPASLARILILNFAWERGKANEYLAVAQAQADHLCAVGAVWLDWLQTKQGQTVATTDGQKLIEKRNEWAAWIRAKYPKTENILRIATNLASNSLTFQIATAHPVIGSIIAKQLEQHHAGLLAIAETMAAYTAQSLEASRFLEALRELLSTKQAVLVSDDIPLVAMGAANASDIETHHLQDRVIGWSDAIGGAYLFPDVTRRMVDRLVGDSLGNISAHALYDQLAELGALATLPKGKPTFMKRLGNRPIRVFHIKQEFLEPDADDDA